MGKRKDFPDQDGEGTEDRAARVAEIARKVANGFYTNPAGIDAIADDMSYSIVETLYTTR
jgi:hypothetical protein